jgi:cellulose synthase (UDP-forming)
MSPEILTLSDAVLYGIIITSLICAPAVLLSANRMLDRIVFGAVVVAFLVSYLWYRAMYTLPVFEFTAYGLWPRLYILLESTVILYAIMSIIFFARRTDRSAEADEAAARLVGAANPPAVDVLICTYNEDLAILERSILTSLAIDYPKFSVWVLDDGGRDWLRDYCREVGANYVRRDDRRGAKAGNIDNGLSVSALTTNAPFILVLDADFAPQKDILKRTVGLFDDSDVGVVQTPQFYYNADPVQHNLLVSESWVDDQRIFFDVMQPSKDAWGASFCVGTSFVVRRDAIEALGGFPKDTVTEDLHLTYALMKRGLRTIWLNERLSVGLSAESLASYITQRCRWCLGTIQLGLLKDGPLRGRGYSFNQRIHYLHGLLFWFCRPFIVALLTAPILYYFLGLPAILLAPEALLIYGLPAVVGCVVFHAWVSGGRALPLFTEVAHIVAAIPVTRTILQAAIKPFGHPFKVTDKGENRSDIKIQYSLAAIFASIIVLTLIGMINGPLLRTYGELDGFSIAWGIVVTIHAFVALLVCIELPRPEIDEITFPVRGPARLRSADGPVDASISEMSVNRVTCACPAAPAFSVGDAVEAEFFDGLQGAGRVVDVGPGTVTLRLDDDADLRRKLIARLFTQAPPNIAPSGRLFAALSALAKRTFGPERLIVGK